MFRYERLNSTRKFTIVAEIVSLLKKIYKSDAPLRAVFNNYRDYNTSLHVSLRTLKFDKKIHYCCRDSFFVEKDKSDAPLRAVFNNYRDYNTSFHVSLRML